MIFNVAQQIWCEIEGEEESTDIFRQDVDPVPVEIQDEEWLQLPDRRWNVLNELFIGEINSLISCLLVKLINWFHVYWWN